GLQARRKRLQQPTSAPEIFGANDIALVEVETVGVRVSEGEDHHGNLDDARGVHSYIGAHGDLGARAQLLRVKAALGLQRIETGADRFLECWRRASYRARRQW